MVDVRRKRLDKGIPTLNPVNSKRFCIDMYLDPNYSVPIQFNSTQPKRARLAKIFIHFVP